MRIDKIHIQNFRGIENLEMDFDKQFTLLVGGNGSGKTSILTAAAISLGIWRTNTPLIAPNDWPSITAADAYEKQKALGGRLFFKPVADTTKVSVIGSIDDLSTSRWIAQKKNGDAFRYRDQIASFEEWGGPEDFEDVMQALKKVLEARKKNIKPCPLLAYYGVGRGRPLKSGPEDFRVNPVSTELNAQLAAGYKDCFSGNISIQNLHQWFFLESAARDENGNFRLGFETVKAALTKGIAGIKNVQYDFERRELVVNIQEKRLLFSHLSDGQRAMITMVADMAIRAVTINSYLITEDLDKETELEVNAYKVLDQTPGVVLIDELDLHLHPKWQRSVVADLRRTFPKVQFICSSHSPQIFGEVPTCQIRVHRGETDNWSPPAQSIGLDSSRILGEQMGAPPRNLKIDKELNELATAIDEEDFDKAEKLLLPIVEQLGENDPEVTRARTLMSFLRDIE